MMRPRVLLADDHTLVLEGFKKLLEPEFDLVGTVEDGRGLLEAAARLKPDVVLLDVSMPLLNGIDAARVLKQAAPRIKVLFVTMHADPAYVAKAFQAGAEGYLLKRSAGTELIHAVKEVLAGRHYITPLVTNEVAEALTRAAASPSSVGRELTPRQREVLQLVAEGRTMKEIAAVLQLSVKTVEHHKAQLMDLLDLHTTAELTRYAIAQGMIAPE